MADHGPGLPPDAPVDVPSEALEGAPQELTGVLFDMDGLLVDTDPVWAGARAWVAEAAGKTWSDTDNQAVMGVTAPGVSRLI